MTSPTVEAVARAILPGAWDEENLTPTERRLQPRWRDSARNQAEAAITAHLASLKAQGYAVVPVEPSEAMVEASQNIPHKGIDHVSARIMQTPSEARLRYQAMLTAAGVA